MPRTRVVIAEVPALLRDIITGWLGRFQDIEIAGETSVRDDLFDLLEGPGADVDIVIVACSDDEVSEIGDRILARRPQPRVLAITDDARRAFLYELCPRKVALGEASADRLVSVIRSDRRASDSLPAVEHDA
jgi:DNA-binding NarL/FixJ family response regulator